MHSFAPPSSPPSSYGCPPPATEDFAKEPPSAPPQLGLTLLNVDAAGDGAGAALPRPSHVVLNHLYMERRPGAPRGVAVMGVTHRYRSKYVTLVVYAPTRAGAAAAAAAQQQQQPPDAGGRASMDVTPAESMQT